MPIVLDQEFDIEFSLLSLVELGVFALEGENTATDGGWDLFANSDFGNSATRLHAQVLDADGNVLPDARITSALGIDYLTPLNVPNPGDVVPEPLTATLGLMSLGVLGMATRRRVA